MTILRPFAAGGLRHGAAADRRSSVNDQPRNGSAPTHPANRCSRASIGVALRPSISRRCAASSRSRLQTVWAPAITTLLYLAIFTVALGGEGPDDHGRTVRRFPGARADRHGDDPERLRQFELLAPGRQDPGQYRRLSDAAVVDRRVDRRTGRRRGDARVPGRVRGVAGDAVVAGRVGRGAPARAGVAGSA